MKSTRSTPGTVGMSDYSTNGGYGHQPIPTPPPQPTGGEQ